MQELLDGAHDMDKHFVETNPRHNVPVLLALADVWNDVLFNAGVRTVIPYMRSMESFPSFLGALEAQACGRAGDMDVSSAIVDGRTNSFSDRATYQSGKVMKDNDLKRFVILNKDTQKQIIRQLDRDTKFLEEHEIMDYSLLLGIYHMKIWKKKYQIYFQK